MAFRFILLLSRQGKASLPGGARRRTNSAPRVERRGRTATPPRPADPPPTPHILLRFASPSGIRPTRSAIELVSPARPSPSSQAEPPTMPTSRRPPPRRLRTPPPPPPGGTEPVPAPTPATSGDPAPLPTTAVSASSPGAMRRSGLSPRLRRGTMSSLPWTPCTCSSRPSTATSAASANSTSSSPSTAPTTSSTRSCCRARCASRPSGPSSGRASRGMRRWSGPSWACRMTTRESRREEGG